jgi:hypothetical protein
MKADVKPADEREKEALAWATDFFANNADDLESGAFFDEAKRVELYTPRLLNDGALDDFCRDLANDARDGDRSCHDNLRLTAALVLERGELLQPHLRDFVVDFLRNPNKKLKPYPRDKSLIIRDRRIAGAILFIKKKWGFQATRGEATRDKDGGASAASIVREALESSVGIRRGEKAINAIWEGSEGKDARAAFESFKLHSEKYPNQLWRWFDNQPWEELCVDDKLLLELLHPKVSK